MLKENADISVLLLEAGGSDDLSDIMGIGGASAGLDRSLCAGQGRVRHLFDQGPGTPGTPVPPILPSRNGFLILDKAKFASFAAGVENREGRVHGRPAGSLGR